jgi:hypothetical protein
MTVERNPARRFRGAAGEVPDNASRGARPDWTLLRAVTVPGTRCYRGHVGQGLCLPVHLGWAPRPAVVLRRHTGHSSLKARFAGPVTSASP